MLLASICKCEFIVGILSLSSFLCVKTMVNKLLQSKWQDICKANEIISDVILSLKEKRKNATTGFHELEIELKTEIDLWKLKSTRIQNEGKMYKLALIL